MSIISRSIQVTASPEDTWRVVRDFGGVHRWHAKVESSPLLSSNNEGLGAKRRCEFYDKSSVVEEIISYDEGDRFLEVSLSEFSMPLTQATATMKVDPAEGGGAEVTLSMNFGVKYGPIGWVMDRAMMRPMMGKMFGQVLDGLRTHLETGQPIGEGGTVTAQVAMA